MPAMSTFNYQVKLCRKQSASDTGIFTSYLYYISMFIFFKHIFVKNIYSKFLILYISDAGDKDKLLFGEGKD